MKKLQLILLMLGVFCFGIAWFVTMPWNIILSIGALFFFGLGFLVYIAPPAGK